MNNQIRKLAILTFVVLAFLLLPFLNSDSIAQEKVVVTVKEGSFIFSNLSLTKEVHREGLRLMGLVFNNTTKDWSKVFFEIELYNSDGNEMEASGTWLYFFDFKKGDVETIGTEKGRILNGYITGILREFISRYEIRFIRGENPARYSFAMIKPKESRELLYEDNFLKVLFSVSTKQLAFVLQNKTDNPIKIDWNQLSYVDELGKSHKVMHSGIKYWDREKPQPPTIVPPTAKLEDILFPIDYVKFSSGKDGGWRHIPLFPEDYSEAKIYEGMSFSVFMSLEINGVVKNYIFTFKIEGVES